MNILKNKLFFFIYMLLISPFAFSARGPSCDEIGDCSSGSNIFGEIIWDKYFGRDYSNNELDIIGMNSFPKFSKHPRFIFHCDSTYYNFDDRYYREAVLDSNGNMIKPFPSGFFDISYNYMLIYGLDL